MTTLLLDTHAVYWWSNQPELVSDAATEAIRSADEVAVAAVTWYELAWLAHHDRIRSSMPIRRWLELLAAAVSTIGLTPAIADLAAGLPATFPGDPADRQIFATAIDRGFGLVTKDRRLRKFRHPQATTIW